jgi:transposase
MAKSSADAVFMPDQSRLRWNRKEARAVMAALEASGLSAEKFAEREGLKPARVIRWQRKLQLSERPTAPKFVELDARPARAGSTRVELVLRSSHVLFLGESFDPASLRRILELLERDGGC